MHLLRSPRLLLAALALTAAGAACSDDEPTAEAPATTGDAGTDAAGTDAAGADDIVDAIGGDGARDAIDAVGLEGLAEALVTALDADRFEIDGETLHIHFPDGSSNNSLIGCVAAGALVPEGTSVVLHGDGQTTEC